ncbi:MAG: 50S ribosomal protein L17 [Verrucomicrobiales bacterium]
MRHRRKTVKLGRSQAHRRALFTNQACSLIEHSQIKTTLAKAKALRPIVEKLVTLGKRGDLHARRVAISKLGSNQRAQKAAKRLFEEIAPANADRQGGYTRIVKLGVRQTDAAPMAFIEWVDRPASAGDDAELVGAEEKE